MGVGVCPSHNAPRKARHTTAASPVAHVPPRARCERGHLPTPRGHTRHNQEPAAPNSARPSHLWRALYSYNLATMPYVKTTPLSDQDQPPAIEMSPSHSIQAPAERADWHAHPGGEMRHNSTQTDPRTSSCAKRQNALKSRPAHSRQPRAMAEGVS